MTLAVNYFNDLGETYYYVSLNFRLVDNNNSANSYLFNEILPDTIVNSITNLQTESLLCKLPIGITPRLLTITADDTNTYSTVLPFKGGSNEFISTMDELEQSNLVSKFRVIGERINYQKLLFRINAQ